jgi:hypothetical protein
VQDVADLALIIDSSVPIVVLETRNELRALEILTRVALQRRLGFNSWSITEGMRRAGFFDALSLPDDAQLMAIVRAEVALWSADNPKVKTDHQTLKKLIKNVQGLSRDDARRLVRAAIRDDGAITAADMPEINRAKFVLIDMDGVLSFEYDTQKFSQLGGLEQLKACPARAELS